jgi:ferritin
MIYKKGKPMKRTIYDLSYKLSLEVHDIHSKKSTEEEITIYDAIEISETNTEVADLENDIKAKCDHYDKICNTITNINEKANELTTKYNSGIITTTDIAVAQEACRLTIKQLGYNSGIMLNFSKEDAASYPLQVAKLSIESMKTFIDGLIEKLIMLFKQIGNSVKKIYAKITILLNNNKKVAIGIKNYLEDSNYTTNIKQHPAEEVNKINNLLAIAFIAPHVGTNITDPVSILIDYIKTINNTTQIKETEKLIVGIGSIVIPIINKTGEYDPTIKTKIENMIDSYINKTKHSTPMYTNMLEVMEVQLPNSEATSKDIVHNTIITKAYGKHMTSITFDVFNKFKESKDAFPTIHTTITNVSNKDVKDMTYTIPSKQDIIKLLDTIINNTLESKLFSDLALTMVDISTKTLNKITSETKKVGDITPETKNIISRYSNLSKLAVSRIALDGIIGQVKGTKAVVQYCNLVSNYYRK